MVTTRLAGQARAQALVAELRRRYPHGFVAHLQGNVLPRMTQLTRYLVKYVVSPPMALSRILAYDRERGTVTYWYRDHLRQGKRTVETVDRTTFIGRMVQHILPKGFQRIRYYGLQATCTLAKVRQKVVAALHGAVQQVLAGVLVARRRVRYRDRMRATLGRDPLLCPRCGAPLWLWRIWHPRYGTVYDELAQLQRRSEVPRERSPGARVDADRAGDARTGEGSHVQLPLFPLPA
jgi:hypothetical protein